MNSKRINLIARSNGVGLDRDVDLVARVLEKAGHEVVRSHCREISPAKTLLRGSRKRFCANIFMERVFLRWLGEAEHNILIPNQERFPRRQLFHLNMLDAVFTKSLHAQEVFEPHHAHVSYTGFTSVDMRDLTIPKKPQSYLHLAGRSTLKGTDAVIDLWRRNPEWPELTLIQCKENAQKNLPDHVNLISDYLSDFDLKRLLNERQVHLCPSLSEGWGHYIAEALSCGALVVTTDAPPMNELVTRERGVVVKCDRSEPRHLGRNFMVCEEDLERQVSAVVNMNDVENTGLLTEGRRWFEKNDLLFQERLLESVEAVCGESEKRD